MYYEFLADDTVLLRHCDRETANQIREILLQNHAQYDAMHIRHMICCCEECRRNRIKANSESVDV